MTTSSLQDRRQFAQEQLAAMAGQTNAEHPAALRAIAARVLGFTPADAILDVDRPQLPDTAAVIGTLPNEFGPDYLAVHYDLSAGPDAGRRDYITLAQVQAANERLQRHAAAEHYPLLIFTLPDGGGVQFVTGNPTPGNPQRLQDVIRVTAYWRRENRTALDCLEQVGKAIAEGKVPQQAFHDGFSLEPVTKAFFAEYKTTYDRAVSNLLASGGIAPTDAGQFTQTLFNRLLFIHFVSRKGWLSFNGDPDYLNALWRDHQSGPRETNFYIARLSPLFFAGLNNPQSRNLMRDNPVMHSLIGDVPFLNGGLFEPTPLDHQADNGVFAVPDDCIAPLLTDLFRRYNFTVMEATPLDTEVAVDPEMLGKLFEETVNERHSHGAFYTPRPVVAFMCREALKGYLGSQAIAGLSPDHIADLVDRANARNIAREQAIAIAQAVGEAKVLDPACGSGAFLLGMMQEIIALNDSLFRAGAAEEILYRQKLNIISRNLHGVDQDPAAVGIAMLRLWLSLAVDYDGAGPPDPLPNLELKLAAGDAVAGPDPQQLDFTRQSIVNSELQQNIADYTIAHGQRKTELKAKVAAARQQLRDNMRDAAPHGAIEWRIDFADVMLNGGFDIVIANPPYVRQEEIKPDAYKNGLARNYPQAAGKRSDLYCYFYARALQLLRPRGMHVFVCSNSWLDVGYGAKLQEYLLNNAAVEAIYESAVERQFSTAAINTLISIIRKGAPSPSHQTRFVRLLDPFESALKPDGKKRVIVKTADELRIAGTDASKIKPANKRGQNAQSGYVGDKWGGKYLRAPQIYHHILSQYKDKLVRLGDIATVRFGIKTGANDFFYLKPARIKQFGIEPEFLAPVMTSPTESKSIIVDPATLPYQIFMCHKEKAELKGAGALAYIEWAEREKGYHRRPSTSSRRNWYDLGNYAPPPITMNRIIDERAKAFTMPAGVYADATLQEVHCEPEAVETLTDSLNHDFAQIQYNIAGRTNFGGGALELKIYETEQILVENPNIVTIGGGGGIRITPEERKALEAALRELVNHRRLRARSA